MMTTVVFTKEASRSWLLPIGLQWDDALRYVLGQWTASGVNVKSHTALLSTDRNITADTLDELLPAIKDVHTLVRTVVASLDLSEFVPAKLGVKAEDLQNRYTEGRLYVSFPDEHEMTPRAYRMALYVEFPEAVPAEGTACLLAKTVDEWVLANAPREAPAETASTASDVQTPTNAPALSTNGVEAQSQGSLLGAGARAWLSGIVGVIMGLTIMSVIAYGFDEGPTLILAGLSTTLLCAILIYRFGLNR